MKRRVAIIEAKRTPIGKFLGAFRHHSAVELGKSIVRGVLERTSVVPSDVDEVIFHIEDLAGNKSSVTLGGITGVEKVWAISTADLLALGSVDLTQVKLMFFEVQGVDAHIIA